MENYKYAEFDPNVAHSMSIVEKFLLRKYGRIERSWNVSLQILADNLQRYYEAKKMIDDEGIYIKSRNGYTTRHPLLELQKNLQVQINKALNEFGLTPKSILKKTEEPVDETEDLKNILLGGSEDE